MSSILKALKKLEREFPQQDEAVSWPHKIDTKKAISKRTKGAWIFKKLISVFFAAVILAAGVWLFLSQKPLWMKKFFSGTGFFNQSDEKKEMASVPVRKKVKKGPVPASRREIVERKMPRPSISKTSSADSPKKDTGAAKSTEKYDRAEKVDLKMPALVQKTSENTLKPGSREEPGIDEQKTVPETKTSSPGLDQRKTPGLKKAEKPGPGEMAEDKKFVFAKIMDDSKLELQAIAWSIDAKKRIAVINGRVVREGATIEGFLISRIGKDEVFVMEGRELRKLVFTIK